jgi:Sulfotransferase family
MGGYDAGVAAPILVTGSHRSGTTWVGKMLLRSGMAYVQEQFNPQRYPGWPGFRLPHWYLYVCKENEGPYVEAFERVLALRFPLGEGIPNVRSPRAAGRLAREWYRGAWGRLRGARVLVKDPIALFSSDWLAERFGMAVVVMIRHPAAFAGSLKKLDWRFDFRNWAGQPLLLRDHLAPFEERIREFAARPPDLIEQAILMWNGIHHAIAGYRNRRPDWVFVKHEDLAEGPVDGFRDIAARLDVPWTERLRRAVARHSGGGNPAEVPTWRHQSVRRDSRATSRTWLHRLTEEERARVRSGTEEVARRFYSDSDWVPA